MQPLSPKKQLLLAAQEEANLTVAHKRLDLLRSLQDLDEMKAEDDYKLTITTALEAFQTPLALSFISRVLPDGPALAAARKSLREPNEKEQRGPITKEDKDPEDKTKLMIRLVAQSNSSGSEGKKPAPTVDVEVLPPATRSQANPDSPAPPVAAPVTTA